MNADIGGISTPLLVSLGVVVGIVLVLVIIAILRWKPQWVSETQGAQAVSIAQALDEINKLKGTNEFLWNQFRATDSKNRELEELRRLDAVQIVRLTEEVRVLREQLEEKNLITPLPGHQPVCVLGIWTTAPGLDPNANEDALAVAGVEYTALIGPRASMEAISYALPLRNYTTLECGAEGDATGIKLSDGMATPQWWVDLAREFPKLENFLFLSDHSGAQEQTSIADRVYGVPSVRAVISLDGPVEDVDARRFARRLYATLGEGQPMGMAFRMARIAVGPQLGKLFRLREKSQSGD